MIEHPSVMGEINSYNILNTPVALFVFNRPDTTRLVFEQIKLARPSVLLIVADGPRLARPDDRERCMSVRSIVDQVDWPCEVFRNYSEFNLGCRERISTGLDWVFSQFPEAIILEDDCLPNPSFFRFCEQMLERYRDDGRVMHIGGCNFQGGKIWGDGSYYFSRYNHIWGWASWSRAWRHYDVTMASFPQFVENERIRDLFGEKRVQNYWLDIFQRVYSSTLLTWDYQWTFAMWQQDGLAILPNQNLVSNIGFRKDATHTDVVNTKLVGIPTFPMGAIVHPSLIAENQDADWVTFKVFNLSRWQIFKLHVSARFRRIFRHECSESP